MTLKFTFVVHWLANFDIFVGIRNPFPFLRIW